MLRKHLAEQNWKKQIAGKAYNDTDLVFADELGNPIEPRTFCRRFEKMIEVLMIEVLMKENEGFPKVTFHGLRHAFATICIDGGEKVHDVQDKLGHSTYNLTMNTYRHAGKKKSASVISAIL
ncbi:MAG: tyrosine-type recombinase/integrase [Dethiobacter sp.]|jgi:integrase|nr:tyrosine-type recombinase/integrase [Dethiobacter sp.]